MTRYRFPDLPRFAVHGNGYRITLDGQHDGSMSVTLVNEAACGSRTAASITLSPASLNALTTFLQSLRQPQVVA